MYKGVKSADTSSFLVEHLLAGVMLCFTRVFERVGKKQEDQETGPGHKC